MNDAVLLGVLLAAVAIGYALGYRRPPQQRSKQAQSASATLSRDYFVGLNYLLDEQPDEAIQTFIQALDVNSDNVDTHIALGKLFRTRGEADKAVSIHQNLLARPVLTAQQNEQVQLELAQDFIALGMHDRTQRLLNAVIARTQSDEHRMTAKQLLVDLLEREKAWQEALDITLPILGQQPDMCRPAAHWLCEIAEQAIRQSHHASAERHLKKALQLDAQCVRAILLLAELALNNGHARQSIAYLDTIPQHARPHIPTMLPLLERAYWQADDMPGFEQHLVALLDIAPLTSVIIRLSELVHQRAGVEQAIEITATHLHHAPSLRGLDHLVDLYMESQQLRGHDPPDSRLWLLKHHTQALLKNHFRHRCTHCGYRADTLHWQCPSCRRWGSIEPVTGVEGE